MIHHQKNKDLKVVVAMSGGVDSSVTASILKEQGYSVSGMIMRLWGENQNDASNRKMQQAIDDAGEMADFLQIPLRVVDFQKEFKKTVIDYFITAYENATTPNPCPVCNKRIKFGLLLKEAEQQGAGFLATGHYARIEKGKDGFRIRRGVDEQKDQTYFLYQLNQQQLAHLLFPLGDMLKSDVRKIAHQGGFPMKDRPESQDICFIEDNNYRRFLATHSLRDFEKGPIKDRTGKVLGQHSGLPNYTIGQRRGIGVSAGEPLYVTGMNPDDNTITVGTQAQRIRFELTVGDVNFISGNVPRSPITVDLKIRYAAKRVPATLKPLGDGRIHLASEQSLYDVAPGQSAVFYQDDVLIGGGIIER